MNAAQVVGDVIHDLLGMNVVVAQQVDVVVLSLQGPVLRPGIRRAVQLQLPHLLNFKNYYFFTNPAPVFRIRIQRIHMFLGLPDPDPLVRGMDPDPSIIMQK